MPSLLRATSKKPSAAETRRCHRPIVTLWLLGALALGACVGCSDDDEGRERPPLPPTSNATGAGNMTSPGTGASSGTTNAVGNTSPNVGAPGPSAGNPAAPPSASNAPADMNIDPAAEVQQLDDGQILFVADALNAGEVDQARAVLPRLQTEGARGFAREMLDEHEPARDSLLQLAEDEGLAPRLSTAALSLRAESERQVMMLLETSDAELDAVYLDSQVVAHDAALELLDGLIDAADTAALEQQLAALRSTVEAHSSLARQLQAELVGAVVAP
jgi:putative membrane protein